MTIREVDRTLELDALASIDTSYQTSTVFDLVPSARRLELRERALEAPITKRYAMDEVFAHWARWTVGWVAEEDGAIRGLAVVGHEPWHERIVLWFLYVDLGWRGRGLARALLARVEAHGRQVGATHVWAETTTFNAPAIAAYERLGYGLIGADLLLYGLYLPGESAIYLAKML